MERRVRWGDPSGKLLKSKEEWGSCTNDGRTITLNPLLRRKAYRTAAWQVFCHELGHMFNCAMTHKKIGRVTLDGKVTETKWQDMSHKRIDQSATPMGALMMENPGIFSPVME